MSAEFIKVTINEKEFQVPKGARLIDVCREKSFEIPSFCYYKDLELQASCRMCLVRIEKMPKLQTSCTIICTDGMNVTTESDEIRKAQRGMMEFLLANHPLDCPVCDRGGECELQETAMDWGGLEERFQERKNARPEKYLSPIVANDPQRCILCKRCTRVCDEWMGEEAIEAEYRGANTVIGTMGEWLNCSQCGNCIEVCPTGTLLDATYRHQARPWELTRTISTCNFCSDGCQMSLGSRGDEVLRVVARDRYVNGHNGEFLCIKGRFAHPFINHPERIKTPLIRYKKGGKLIPATWDDAIRFVAQKLDGIADAHGTNAIGAIASPRLTNEGLYAFHKFAAEIIETENIAGSDSANFQAFFNNLGGEIATHWDVRYANTIILLGGNPSELQPLMGRQIRQAVRNNNARLIVVNSVPIRLSQRAAQFIHIRPGAEDAFALALANGENDDIIARKSGVYAEEISALRRAIGETQGSVVILCGEELSSAAQAVVAQLPHVAGGSERQIRLHPLPRYNNSVGLHDVGFMRHKTVADLLGAAGGEIKALYLAGGLLPQHFEGNEDALGKLEFVVVQELFATDTTAFADVVLPAASYAEQDGTFTNSGGLVQRVRQSIPYFNQARPDWMIVDMLARELGVDLGFQLSASQIFTEFAGTHPAYTGLNYAALKDETQPARAKYEVTEKRDLSDEITALQNGLQAIDEAAEMIYETPKIGTELFKPGVLTGKTAQFHLLAAGNPEPPTTAVSPLYQITLDPLLRRDEPVALAGD